MEKSLKEEDKIMPTNKKIDVTDHDMRKFIAIAYRLSVPHGLGNLHYKPGPIPSDVVDSILSACTTPHLVIQMDYVLGRSVKMSVFKGVAGRKYIKADWYDHTPEQLAELLERSKL